MKRHRLMKEETLPSIIGGAYNNISFSLNKYLLILTTNQVKCYENQNTLWLSAVN